MVLEGVSSKAGLIAGGAAAGLAALAAVERVGIRHYAQMLPGPRMWVPGLGQLWELIWGPWEFYERMAEKGPLAWAYVLGKVFIHSRDSENSRKILSSAAFVPFLSLNALKILTKKTRPPQAGDEHKALKSSLIPLFTPKAMANYLPIQERCLRQFIAKWTETVKEPTEFRPLARDATMNTSIQVFVGPHVAEATRSEIADMYYEMNRGFLCLPINLPGTQLNKSVKARERLIRILKEIAQTSYSRMQRGEEPFGVLDIWMQEILAGAEKKTGEKRLTEEQLETVSFTLMAFMFASQDASTSSLVWVVTLLHKHPEVLQRIREENARLRPQDEAFTLETLNEMEYMTMAVKEVLRYRPPATMVPHEAVRDTPLGSDGYVAKKGTVVFPSIWCASFENFTDPHAFDPERFNAERREDEKFPRNMLVFGMGAHVCLGKAYATNQLKMFTSLLATHADWDRLVRDGDDEIVFTPTICPKSCMASFKPAGFALKPPKA
eukprot:tig00001065_g6729.t1